MILRIGNNKIKRIGCVSKLLQQLKMQYGLFLILYKELICNDYFLQHIPGRVDEKTRFMFLYEAPQKASLKIYSTVTLLAKFLGLSTSMPLRSDK